MSTGAVFNENTGLYHDGHVPNYQRDHAFGPRPERLPPSRPPRPPQTFTHRGTHGWEPSGRTRLTPLGPGLA